MSRFLLGLGLTLLMVLASFGTFMYLGGRQSKVALPPEKPTATSPRPQALYLPGTLYLAQNGALYSLSFGRFHELTPESGWTQPALFPDGSKLLAVNRSFFYSDVFVLNPSGTVVRRLTNNNPYPRNHDTTLRHWSFYPRLTFDQRTLLMSYDEPKFGYDVPLSIWAMPYGGTIKQGRLMTNSNDYTGGDVEPVPLHTGGFMYTKYSYGPDANLIGQLWFTNKAYSYGRALTTPSMDCSEPSISPSGNEVAMICTYEKQIANLVIASFNGSSLRSFRAIITNQMVAQPTWAPDGSGIAYFAPGAAAGPFQLWWLPKAAYNPPRPSPTPTPTPTPGGPYNGSLPSPSPIEVLPPAPVNPIQVTISAGFDATSPMTWAA